MATEAKRRARASEASERERVWALLSRELGAVALGEEPGLDEAGPEKRLDVPEVERGYTASCVLCGNLTIWRSVRNGAPVHRPCMEAYVEGRR